MRDIALSARVDDRLTEPMTGDSIALGAFLRRGLTRMLEAGGLKGLALTLLPGDGAEDSAALVLEVTRMADPAASRPTALVDLWTLPLRRRGGRPLRPLDHRSDGEAESVRIALPCSPAPRPGTSPDGGAPDLSGRRILIAEDAETNQVLLRAVLAPTGAAVEVVSDGVALVERHRAEPADLILLDLHMPEMGGLEALRHIRAMKGATAAVKIVAQTAYARSADRKRALDAGADAFVAKPIVVAEFSALIGALLNGT